MRIQQVEGGHLVGLGHDPSKYRVRIWGPDLGPRVSRTLDEWEITDAPDVRAALDWADENAGGLDAEVFAVLNLPAGTTYIRVAGVDGDAGSGTSQTIEFTV